MKQQIYQCFPFIDDLFTMNLKQELKRIITILTPICQNHKRDKLINLVHPVWMFQLKSVIKEIDAIIFILVAYDTWM